ncbi:uncharacterized protein LOC126830824 [Patella vulgata]|uniref:uncharacterized protein LOC126830824 n=1 Tax=Patella vulgata TaxID=6465 RepID=UPI0021809193|nr:uncharacterized protein LOC126830824 [Patella vulgata]
MAFVENAHFSEDASESCDKHIDYTNLGPRFKKQLEYAYVRAGIDDRKRCFESLNSVDVEDSRTRRPYTAMPILERTGSCGEDGFQAPYATTYKKQYYPKKYPITIATRPMTTGTNIAPPEARTENTHYDFEYSRKIPNPNHIYRTGSASGTRNNKPHPSKDFLIWRFPGNTKPSPRDYIKENVTDAKLNEIHRRLCRSTYQSDYLGMPQGYEIVPTSPGLLRQPSYALDSFQRSTYKVPVQPDRLKLATTRYGSNNNKYVPVYGTIPQANGNTTYGNKVTTYDRYYNHNDSAPYSDKGYLNDIRHRYGMNGTYEPVSPATPISSGGMRKMRSMVPSATPVTCFTPQPVVY